MRKYIVITALAIIISPLVFSEEIRNLDTIVKNRAIENLKMGQNLSDGRKSLLLEMEKFPGQLAADIKRIPITIGGTLLSEVNRMSKSDRDLFLLVAANLEKYVKQSMPSMKLDESRGSIGQFSTTEVIYPIVQNFLGPITTRAFKDIGEGWASKQGTAKLSASFKISGPGILEVITKSEKPMINLNNEKEVKNLILESITKFNLNSGMVTFGYSYVFQGLPKLRGASILFPYIVK